MRNFFSSALRAGTAVALLTSALTLSGPAFADGCGQTNDDAKRLLAEAKTAESQGKKEQALFKFKAATGYFCEKVNPYAPEAAKRAAPLGLELGAAAEKRGAYDLAKQLYEAGGHYAPADRAFMQTVRANAESVGMYQAALKHFVDRKEGWFKTNNEASYNAVPGYSVDTKLIAEVNAMPARALASLTRKETAAFNEEYISDYVKAFQSNPDDPTDAAGVQRSIAAHQAFAQKWKVEDQVKVSRETIRNLRYWGNVDDAEFAKSVLARTAQLIEQRANTLRTKYSGSPKLLEDAIDYYQLLGSEDPKAKAQIAATKAQAAKLGDEANAKQRLLLAAEYYDTAGQGEKADATRERAQSLAMQKMKPQIDKAQKEAEAFTKDLSDPARIEEIKRSAEAARKAMEAQKASQPATKAANRKSAEDLEKELGL